MTKSVQRIGIFGGGQLGRMMAQAALPLGIGCVFYESNTDCPAAATGKVIDATEADALSQFSQVADVYSLEFENTVLADVDQLIAMKKQVHPSRDALAIAQNRLSEKNTFKQLDIPVAPFLAVHSQDDLQHAVSTLGLPLVVKTATGGYDGKGQFVIKTEADIAAAWQQLGTAGELIAEQFVNFQREVSIIAVRDQQGEVRCWSLAENHHHQGILSHSIVPAPNSQLIQPQAEQYIQRLLSHLEYVGVLTLELFDTEGGLYANEMAPRVHNSGHWSIEAAICSQFENHMRAVAGLPLGRTEQVAPCVMVNIIGQHPNREEVVALANTHLHLYGKTERAGRKLGHITIVGSAQQEIEPILNQLARILPEPMALTRS